MAMTFADFVQTELPKRPFADVDGAPGQVLIRSDRPERPRELTWANLPASGLLTLPAGPLGVSGHRAIMIAADGTAAHADPAEARSFFGISTNAAIPGASVTVATRDTLTESSWAWTPGQPIYFVADGMLTQTVPTATAVTPVGVAISATTIMINRDAPVFLSGA